MTATHRYFVTTALSAKQRKIPKKSAKPTPKKNITNQHNKKPSFSIFSSFIPEGGAGGKGKKT
jgi:hypothetical protein